MRGFGLFRNLFKSEVKQDLDRRSDSRVDAREGLRILVVDDSATVVAVLGRMLRQAHYEIIAAESGEAALESLNEHAPDLIFLDIVLPGMSGFAALRALRRDPRTAQVPVIMISGNLRATEEFYGQRIGADDFMKKPFGRSEVFNRIQRLVDNGRLPRREPGQRDEALLPLTETDVVPDDTVGDEAVPADSHVDGAPVESQAAAITPSDVDGLDTDDAATAQPALTNAQPEQPANPLAADTAEAVPARDQDVIPADEADVSTSSPAVDETAAALPATPDAPTEVHAIATPLPGVEADADAHHVAPTASAPADDATDTSAGSVPLRAHHTDHPADASGTVEALLRSAGYSAVAQTLANAPVATSDDGATTGTAHASDTDAAHGQLKVEPDDQPALDVDSSSDGVTAALANSDSPAAAMHTDDDVSTGDQPGTTDAAAPTAEPAQPDDATERSSDADTTAPVDTVEDEFEHLHPALRPKPRDPGGKVVEKPSWEQDS